jgi:hypothetical protein
MENQKDTSHNSRTVSFIPKVPKTVRNDVDSLFVENIRDWNENRRSNNIRRKHSEPLATV